MTKTVRVAEDIYVSLLQLCKELSIREKRNISISEAVRYLITTNPTIVQNKLVQFERRY